MTTFKLASRQNFSENTCTIWSKVNRLTLDELSRVCIPTDSFYLTDMEVSDFLIRISTIIEEMTKAHKAIILLNRQNVFGPSNPTDIE